jgi:transcriptional regulator with XRE-family HTH domain
MDILDCLIQIRKDKKVDQKHLKGYLKITGTTLSRYESKKREIPFSVLIKYAEYFDYEIRLLKK